MATARRSEAAAAGFAARPGAWVEVGLTAPLFLLYHVGIVFLDVRNGADFVTQWLMQLAKGDPLRYLGLTAAVFVVFVGLFAFLGRGQVFVPKKFAQMAIEGAVYAFAMAIVGSRVVNAVFGHAMLANVGDRIASVGDPIASAGPFVGFVMSLGAGFYEELVFRVLVFGLGLKLLLLIFANHKMGLFGPEQRRWSFKSVVIALVWACVAAALFSGVHYVGSMADAFTMPSFVYRFVLGLVLTLIFTTRGFAVAVWTHALYDVWVLVLG